MKPGTLGFVLRSKQRQKLLLLLQDGKTPTELAYLAGVSVPHASRTLKEFREKQLASVENPKKRVNRIYKLTADGREIADRIKKKA